MLQCKRASSCDDGGLSFFLFFSTGAGSLGFLSGYNGDLREPLMLPQGSQPSFQVANVTLGYLSSSCRGIRLHLELRQETQGSSPVATEISGILSSFNRESGLISCGSMELRFPLEL